MSMSNTTENATLKMHLQGTDPAYRAGATQYLALFTADPGETGSLAAEGVVPRRLPACKIVRAFAESVYS